MPQMRMQSLLIAVIILLSGCATQLHDASVSQGETLTDFHYKMVLDNIAMFRVRSNSVPWHIKITGGGAQVDSSVTPSLSFEWPPIARTLGLSGSHGVTINWALTPVISPGQLKALQDRYRNETTEQNFEKNYNYGYAAPNEVYGKYGGLYVWPKDWEHFVSTVLAVLEDVSVAKKDETPAVPGGPAPVMLTPLR